MKWEMEVLSSYLSNATWLIDENRKAKWTQEENKIFENALAVYDKDTSDRWQKVASMIPGKTVGDVIKQYKELEDDVSSIEAGLVSIPDYNTPSAFTLEWVNHNCYEGYKYTYGPGGKRGPGTRGPDQERKKGVPWTEEEHKLFLLGLQKYGKGDWRNISRNFVVTRTPTQVASHAQKYFIRQLSGGKDKRRASIHDITTVNLDNEALSPDINNSNRSSSPEQTSSTITEQTQHHQSIPRSNFQWAQKKSEFGGEEVIAFDDSIQGNMFISPNIDPFGFRMQGQNVIPRGDFLQNYIGSQNMGFQIQPTQNYSHG